MRQFLLIAVLAITARVVSPKQYQAGPAVMPDDPRLLRLEQFFAERDCPLRDSAADFLVAADQNQLDWRLLPSIAFLESSGGKDYTNNNVLGWDSCRESFPSVQAGIHFVAAQLAKSKRYKDKDLDAKLETYNPVPEYSERVKAVMQTVGDNQ